MVKRTAAISAIILVICLLLFAAICPLAISDSVKLAQQAAPHYEELQKLFQYSAEGISSVSLVGQWIDSLEVRPSNDNQIHVLTDNYRIFPANITPRVQNGYELELVYTINYPSTLALLTQENIERALTAQLNNTSINKIVLELPASVSFNPSEYGHSGYYLFSFDDRVSILEKEDTAEIQNETSDDEESIELSENEADNTPEF